MPCFRRPSAISLAKICCSGAPAMKLSLMERWGVWYHTEGTDDGDIGRQINLGCDTEASAIHQAAGAIRGCASGYGEKPHENPRSQRYLIAHGRHLNRQHAPVYAR